MTPTDRRTFLKAAGATLATSALASSPAMGQEPRPKMKWKKAFMLGSVSKGPVLPHFRLLKEAGFEGVELLSPNEFDLTEVLKARDETGLVIHGISGSVHWSSPLSSPDPAVVDKGLAAIRKSIIDCRVYGGTTVLLVPAIVTPKVSHREAYLRSQANIRKVISDAESEGIKIAIEEVWNKFLLSAPEFAKYIDEFASPSVGAYFDVGNVVEFGYPQEWILELNRRILKIHVKEYAKSKRFNYPLGEGKEIDWTAIRNALDEVNYAGWITAEVGLTDLDGMRDVVERMDKILG
jgi:L-ribulose-5-phosphate 3-epimerase